MFGKVGRRATGAAFAGVAMAFSAGVFGTAGANAAAVTPGAGAPGAARPGGAVPGRAVPWQSVGAGWVLAEDSARAAGPATLYLASPAGAKYALRAPGGLVAWSSDKTEALFQLSAANKLEQLNLRTGKASGLNLPAGSYALGYARPAGQQVLGVAERGSTATLATYSLSGKLVQVLGSARYTIDGIGTANGGAFAISGSIGLRLVSNSGKLLRYLTVTAATGCDPVRWWTASTVLATCTTTAGSSSYEHLYLVPATGARPTQLTPFRASSYDLGDFDAWQLPSGLYLQSFGACGTLEVNRQAEGGSITPVPVPGTSSPSYQVVTAAGPRLLIETLGCTGAGQLLWLNPATRAETWLFTRGAAEVVPFADSLDPLVQI
jgi:TolB protein